MTNWQKHQTDLQIDGGRRDCGDDGRFGASPEGVLEDTGELRLAVRHVGGPLHQGRDHPPQRQQGLVDVAGFAGTLVHSPRTTDVLAASKIDLYDGQRAMSR